MNKFFYQVFLPYTVAGFLGLFLVIQNPSLLWYTLIAWFFTGFLGIGVGFHRLFSHRQYATPKWIEYTLAILGTLSGYGPLLYWVSYHSTHHKYADTDKDPSSPIHGFWHAALTWNLKKSDKPFDLISYPCKQILRDPKLMWINNNFSKINWVFFGAMLCINYEFALAGYALCMLIERVRIGFVTNYILHSKWFPGNYRNVDTPDNSSNNIFMLPLAMGFNLHNNHHADSKLANERLRWFEFDLEYLFIKMIRK